MTGNSIKPSDLDESFVQVFIEELASETFPSVSDADELSDIALDPSGETQTANTHEVPDEPTIQAEKPVPDNLDRQPDPDAASYRWQLRISKPDQPECVLPLEEESITIGRRTENAVVLKCHSISRDHARIWLDKSGPRIKDLGSRNGTWVNETKVPAAYLRVGDIVKIGTMTIHIEHAASND